MEFARKPEHAGNAELTQLLKRLNGLLEPVEMSVAANYQRPKYPPVFIISLPRSGSTLALQWLASLGHFAYPSNLLARFYAAPHVGALIQRMMTDPKYNFGNELQDFNQGLSFTSTLGKTRGVLAPNEFWYFWRRFFPSPELVPLNEQEFSEETLKKLLAELAAIEAAFDLPLAMKGLNMNFNLPWFSRLIPNAVFLYIKRNPAFAMQSLFESRLNYYGDIRAWWSIKPKEYEFLKDRNPCEQIAGQVYYTTKAIEAGFQQIAPERVVSVDYVYFCRAPAQVFEQLKKHLTAQGLDANWDYTGPQSFQDKDKQRLNDSDWAKLNEAYSQLARG
jgi:hypothetical protein